MSAPVLGEQVPDFEASATSGQIIRSTELKGKNLVLYFYPKDKTPGCTLECRDFRDLAAAFDASDTVILGVSRDSLSSHRRFKEQECLPFELLADTSGELCALFDVIKEKNMYGKKVRGIERSTFLIDSAGILQKSWRKVEVEGHAAEVLAAVNALR